MMRARLAAAVIYSGAVVFPAAPARAILPPQVAGLVPAIAATCPLPGTDVPNPLTTFGPSVNRVGVCSFSPPPFPYYGPYKDEAGVLAEARRMSDRLKAYIERWLDGKAPGKIPQELIPDGILPQIDRTSFTLVRPSQVTAREQWGIRKAFDFAPGVPYQYRGASPAAYPDPHTTYFLNPAVFVPFGTKIVIQGRFPRARFFDLQPSPSFDPTYYREQSALGNQETPIVDADINPDCGSVNPFRVYAGKAPRTCREGARRARYTRRGETGRWRDGMRDAPASRRRFTTIFTAAAGDPTKLDEAASFPFRDPDNHRFMGPIQFQGPIGCDKSYSGLPTGGGGLGCWDVGDIWGRYYAPDPPKGKGQPDPFAGVGLPKITYVLPDGRRFYIKADFSALQKLNDLKGTPPTGEPRAPNAVEGPTEGWHKEFSILRVILEDVLRDSFGGQAPGLAVPDAVDPPGTGVRAKYVRDVDRGALAHDDALPKPNNTQHGATEVPFIDYLIRILAKERGKVVVITGKLPTFPDTRNGLKRMQGAQMRYLSFTAYSPPLTSGKFESNGTNTANSSASLIGTPLWSVADDQIQIDARRNYALVLSAPEDRPANATNANDVTWMNYGPTPEAHITLRWMSIKPEWYFKKSPTEDHIGWETDLASLKYDPKVLNTNDQQGFLGEYQPIIHYMTKQQFEALGNGFDLTKVPAWTEAVPGSGS